MEDNNEVSTLEIIKALPSEEILLDIDNLILIISSWKEELLMQQNLTLRLNSLSKTQPKVFKLNKIRYDSELIKSNQKIYTRHRSAPLNVELWKDNKSSDKDLIIFMRTWRDINNFKWIGEELSKEGWPIVFRSCGSNSKTLTEVLEGKEVIPGSADFFLYRIKDLDAVIEAHRKNRFGLVNDSYILMGHSLGALIAFLYESDKKIDGLQSRCILALENFALTNLSKLLQCQLDEIQPKKKNNKKANAIIGFNSFGSLIWPNKKSSGIDVPILLIGGTYDLVTPLISEQFKLFSSFNNSLNRFLIVEEQVTFSISE